MYDKININVNGKPMIGVSKGLIKLENEFARSGHKMWLVGGCVRDSLIGNSPKDIDIATTADPSSAMEIYQRGKFNYHVTGKQFGTITVIVDDQPMEITTLRRDVETDGRHAVVEFTDDLTVDLERRDLTINAIAQTLAGEVIDPFGGKEDLVNGVVRFVGDPRKRIREDYLRILRWFRFYDRYGRGEPDTDSYAAIKELASGLTQISVERKWMEISKILVGRDPDKMLEMIGETIGRYVGINSPKIGAINGYAGSNNPPASLSMGYGAEPAMSMLRSWKASKAEIRTTEELSKIDLVAIDPEAIKAGFGMEQFSRATMEFVCPELIGWKHPPFPVKYADIPETGKAGGDRLKRIRKRWVDSEFTLAKEQLLS